MRLNKEFAFYSSNENLNWLIPARYFKKYGKHPGIKAFVDRVTAAIIGAVFVLGKRQLMDVTSCIIAVLMILVLLRFKKKQAAIPGLLIKNYF